jgi:hypothetical protein
LGSAALLAGLAAPARADVTLSMGLKWNPINYTKPVSATSNAGGGAATPTPLGGWQTTSLDNNFGVFILDGRLGFQISLDVGYGSTSSGSNAQGSTSTDMSYTQFGFALGSKFYITQPKANHVSPYVLLDFFKYFASISTSDKSVSNDQAGYIAGLASPLGINAAFGAEYFFTPSFSLGAEVLGLRFAYTEGDFSAGGGFGGSNSKFTTTNEYFTFYTGISLNYRFAIAGSVHVKEDTGEEPPPEKPVHKVSPPPPRQPEKAPPPPSRNEEPPPENPEEVD